MNTDIKSISIQDSFCNNSIAGGVFLESFITVAAALPSNILAVIGMDKLGRKFFLGSNMLHLFVFEFIMMKIRCVSNGITLLFIYFSVFSTISSGTCAIVMSFIVNKTQNLIVSATFSSVISCGNAALDCLITEIFPTNLRLVFFHLTTALR